MRLSETVVTPWSVFYPGPVNYGYFTTSASDYQKFLQNIWNHLNTKIDGSKSVEDFCFVMTGVWSSISYFHLSGVRISEVIILVEIYTAFYRFNLYYTLGDPWSTVIRGKMPTQDSELKNAQTIPDGSNLDDTLDPGEYFLPGSYSFTNNPYPGNTGWMRVTRCGGDTRQTIYDLFGKPLFGRYGYPNVTGAEWRTF